MNERHENWCDSRMGGTIDELSSRAERFATAYALSRRERQVLLRVAGGSHPKSVGDAIGCGYSSVRTHLRRIYKKSGCSGIRELMILVFSERHPRSGVYPKE